ncbi:MAG: GH3 auxin-responsive promoter family protein [Planctomycetota bacterium]|jgi:hypothetical protein|nr:GH3 auxin-responsive promoter family protein [Planctomycetota bacterium]
MANILGWFFDKVMASRWRRFREDRERPEAAQERALRGILARNAETAFGRAHGFGALAALSGRELRRAYRAATPIRGYDGFAPEIEKMKLGERDVLIPGTPDMFSLTSGTAADPKFCPASRAFIRELHSQHLLWMYNAYRDRPAVNAGKYLVLASPAEMGKTAGGVPYGSMSGKQLASQSIPVRRRMASPWRAQLAAGPEERLRTTLLFAMAREELKVFAAVNPSTLTLLAERLDAWAETLLDQLAAGDLRLSEATDPDTARRLRRRFKPSPSRARRLREIFKAEGGLAPGRVWPNPEMIFTWQGGAAAFFLPRVRELWGDVPMRCLGLRASEGNFTIPLRDGDPSGVLGVGGHFMEFVPGDAENVRPDAETLFAHELEAGKTYRLIVTTSGGFYRYDLADLVEARGFDHNTPEVAFLRRAGAVLSATGEKVTEDQALRAMVKAGADLPLTGFTLTWELWDGLRYVLAVELRDGEARLAEGEERVSRELRSLAGRFDAALRGANVEYRAKRGDGRIKPPRAALLADGSYRRHRESAAAAGRPENQVKPPLLVPPPAPGRAPAADCPFLGAARIVLEG